MLDMSVVVRNKSDSWYVSSC